MLDLDGDKAVSPQEILQVFKHMSQVGTISMDVMGVNVETRAPSLPAAQPSRSDLRSSPARTPPLSQCSTSSQTRPAGTSREPAGPSRQLTGTRRAPLTSTGLTSMYYVAQISRLDVAGSPDERIHQPHALRHSYTTTFRCGASLTLAGSSAPLFPP